MSTFVVELGVPHAAIAVVTVAAGILIANVCIFCFDALRSRVPPPYAPSK